MRLVLGLPKMVPVLFILCLSYNFGEHKVCLDTDLLMFLITRKERTDLNHRMFMIEEYSNYN